MSTSHSDSDVVSRSDFIKSLFRGAHLRSLQSAVQTSTFSYISSKARSRHRQMICASHSSGGNQSRETKYQASISTQMLLNAVSAMITIVLTLPLETLATRSQLANNQNIEEEKKRNENEGSLKLTHSNSDLTTVSSDDSSTVVDGNDQEMGSWIDEKEEEKENLKICHDNNKSTEFKKTKDHQGNILQMDSKSESSSTQLIYASEHKYDDRIDAKVKKNGNETGTTFQIQSKSQLSQQSRQLIEHNSNPSKLISHSSKLRDAAQLWNGLTPSLLLTCNPAIHFTLFDVMKGMLLRRKKGQQQQQPPNVGLRMGEAFVLGTIAKFASTVATYPLIRTKMILIVAQRSRKYRNGKVIEEDDMSIRGILRSMYKQGGIRELFKGCGLILVLHLFRASIFMMVKNRITN